MATVETSKPPLSLTATFVDCLKEISEPVSSRLSKANGWQKTAYAIMGIAIVSLIVGVVLGSASLRAHYRHLGITQTLGDWTITALGGGVILGAMGAMLLYSETKKREIEEAKKNDTFKEEVPTDLKGHLWVSFKKNFLRNYSREFVCLALGQALFFMASTCLLKNSWGKFVFTKEFWKTNGINIIKNILFSTASETLQDTLVVCLADGFGNHLWKDKPAEFKGKLKTTLEQNPEAKKELQNEALQNKKRLLYILIAPLIMLSLSPIDNIASQIAFNSPFSGWQASSLFNPLKNGALPGMGEMALFWGMMSLSQIFFHKKKKREWTKDPKSINTPKTQRQKAQSFFLQSAIPALLVGMFVWPLRSSRVLFQLGHLFSVMPFIRGLPCYLLATFISAVVFNTLMPD